MKNVSARSMARCCAKGERRAPPAVAVPIERGLALEHTRLDVFRTIAEDLVDLDLDAAPGRSARAAIETDPAAPLRVEHEDAEWPAFHETFVERIGSSQPRGQAERAPVRRRDEAGISRHQRRPDAPRVVDPGEGSEALGGQKGPRGGRDRARDAPPEASRLAGDARPRLDLPLALVKDPHSV